MSPLYLRVEKDWRENFMFYAASAIIVCTCLGGIAAYFIFQHGNNLLQMIQLCLAIVGCMVVLTSILTVQKPKVVLYGTIFSIIVSVLIIAFNMIF